MSADGEFSILEPSQLLSALCCMDHVPALAGCGSCNWFADCLASRPPAFTAPEHEVVICPDRNCLHTRAIAQPTFELLVQLRARSKSKPVFSAVLPVRDCECDVEGCTLQRARGAPIKRPTVVLRYNAEVCELCTAQGDGRGFVCSPIVADAWLLRSDASGAVCVSPLLRGAKVHAVLQSSSDDESPACVFVVPKRSCIPKHTHLRVGPHVVFTNESRRDYHPPLFVENVPLPDETDEAVPMAACFTSFLKFDTTSSPQLPGGGWSYAELQSVDV